MPWRTAVLCTSEWQRAATGPTAGRECASRWQTMAAGFPATICAESSTLFTDEKGHWDRAWIVGFARHCAEARGIDSGAEPDGRWPDRNRVFDLYIAVAGNQPGGVGICFFFAHNDLQAAEVQ